MLAGQQPIAINAINHPPGMVVTIADIMALLGAHYVAYYPTLTDVSGSAKAAIMLGHAIFMSRIVEGKQPERKGWFWKTADDWQQATGLSQKEIYTSRKLLGEAGILKETIRGMPARLWFQVDLDRLAEVLCKTGNIKFRAWSWEDRVLKTLLGKPVMYYASLAHITDSATAGLYLSCLLGQYRQQAFQNRHQTGFVSPAAELQQQLKIGKHVATKARDILRNIGIIEEQREHCAQPKLITIFNLDALFQAINFEKTNKKSLKIHSLSECDNQECRNTTINSSGFGKTRVPRTAKQEFRFWRSRSCRNRNFL